MANWVWSHTAVSPAVESQKQVDLCDFFAKRGDTVRSGLKTKPEIKQPNIKGSF